MKKTIAACVFLGLVLLSWAGDPSVATIKGLEAPVLTPKIIKIQNEFKGLKLIGTYDGDHGRLWVFACVDERRMFNVYPVVVPENIDETGIAAGIIAAFSCATFYENAIKKHGIKEASFDYP